MGLWNLFRRRPRPFEITEPISGEFPRVCSDVFDGFLSDRGFKLKEKSYSDNSCKHLHVVSRPEFSDLYVEISLSTDFRDWPCRVDVDLGEGSHCWPDRDWNFIPLCYLANKQKGYPLSCLGDLEKVMRVCAADLLTNGSKFLGGDLAEFRKIRARMNSARSPYMIGKVVDPVSQALKEKYSKE